MKDGTFALIIDNDNAETLELMHDLGQAFNDQTTIRIMSIDWKVQSVELTPLGFENRGRQKVYILERVE